MPVQSDNWGVLKSGISSNKGRALEAVGLALEGYAQAACPVDTGNLRLSHKHQVNGDEVIVGVTAEYGGYVHNGTGKMRARPWLRQAMNGNKKSLAAIFAAYMQRGMS